MGVKSTTAAKVQAAANENKKVADYDAAAEKVKADTKVVATAQKAEVDAKANVATAQNTLREKRATTESDPSDAAISALKVAMEASKAVKADYKAKQKAVSDAKDKLSALKEAAAN